MPSRVGVFDCHGVGQNRDGRNKGIAQRAVQAPVFQGNSRAFANREKQFSIIVIENAFAFISD